MKYVLILKQSDNQENWIKLMEIIYNKDKELHKFLSQHIYELIDDKEGKLTYGKNIVR